MKEIVVKSAILSVITLFSAVAVSAADLRVFGPAGMRAIEKEHAGDRFIVAVWSTDCPPCRRELSLLGEFQAEHPGVPVVLIATDPPENAELVERVLESFDLPGADSWLFGDAGAERLRYSIDPGWRGEMPRSYLYDCDGSRVGLSGPISENLLRGWLEDASSEKER